MISLIYTPWSVHRAVLRSWFPVGALTNFLHWSGATAGTKHFTTLKAVLSGAPFVPGGEKKVRCPQKPAIINRLTAGVRGMCLCTCRGTKSVVVRFDGK